MRRWGLVLLSALSLSGLGCIKSMLLNGQIEGTRQAAEVADTLQDYEVARAASYAGVVQFEGMHRLAPDNEDALFMLTKNWSAMAYAFIEDDMEVAADLHDKAGVEYQKARAIAAYERALKYGLELLSHKASGFEAASRNDATMKAWLQNNFKDASDAPNLLWAGYAWMSRADASREDDQIANLFVGVSMVEHSVRLDPNYAHMQGMTILAAYHARMAQAEIAESNRLFQQVLSATGGKSLIVRFNYAARYLCAKGDKAGFVKTMQEIVAAGDIYPEQRLENVIAKRRARRYLGKARMDQLREDCGFND